MNKKTAGMPALVFASAASLLLAACESSGNYRVGWVGDTPPPGGGTASSSGGDGSSGGTASSSGGTGSSGGASSSSGGGTTSSSGGTGGGATGQVGNLIVTAGNTVIGVAGTSDAVVRGGVLPTAGVVTGTVTGILTRTGQTLVKLGEGTGGNGGALILDGVGGRLGALVGIDLGAGQVIAAPAGSKSLIGVNVLAKNPQTGQLATVSALQGGKVLSVDVNGATGGLLGRDTGLLGNVGKAVTGVTGGLTGGALNGGAAGGVTTGLLGGVTGGVSGGVATPAPQAPTTGVVGGTVKTVGGVVNGVTGGLLGQKNK
ncbi:hypothetical protein [Sphingomonas turrisvirgatae]|uniref:Bacterial collagen-like protein middle domain-containing protein n=1 Tax=Sphingomonas turrisvirgatae TaxID=1888892 RepID=A0A1E3LV32_9SPHN|nr:hypothetical protein [Sphingomonas turrisvirgatae]ODP37015.1 hypothetical protein BFL28_19185 [Sphingomonas turrisvirgatae]